MTTEKLVDKAIEKTIREVVGKTYDSILDDVTCRVDLQGYQNDDANSESPEAIAMRSVAFYFTETLKEAQQETQQTDEFIEQPPMKPLKREQREKALRPKFSMSLTAGIVAAILMVVIMFIVIPLPIEGWLGISLLTSIGVGCIAYMVVSVISDRKCKA